MLIHLDFDSFHSAVVLVVVVVVVDIALAVVHNSVVEHMALADHCMALAWAFAAVHIEVVAVGRKALAAAEHKASEHCMAVAVVAEVVVHDFREDERYRLLFQDIQT